MTKLRVHNFTISLDGYGAGPDQTMDNPLGRGGESLHEWFLTTRTFKEVHGKDGGTTGPDNDIAARMRPNVGAWIMGRNMFGPPRDAPKDREWRGWWGEDPPYHAPVFVITHHASEPITMEGGTTYHFATGGIERARDQAIAAANGKDIIVLGGVSIIRQFLQARLIDELHVAISPILLGDGDALFPSLDLPALDYRVVEHVPTKAATHIVFSSSCQMSAHCVVNGS